MEYDDTDILGNADSTYGLLSVYNTTQQIGMFTLHTMATPTLFSLVDVAYVSVNVTSGEVFLKVKLDYISSPRTSPYDSVSATQPMEWVGSVLGKV